MGLNHFQHSTNSFGGRGREPVCTAALLGAMRRYRILYPPTSGVSGLLTKESRHDVREDDALLQHISSMIVMLHDETISKTGFLRPQASEIGSFILNYERAMCEKLDGSLHNALDLIKKLLRRIKNMKAKQPNEMNIFTHSSLLISCQYTQNFSVH